MQKKKNMCKFITTYNENPFKTTNFVYECTVSFSDKQLNKNTHSIYLVVSGKGRLCSNNSESKLEAGVIFFTFAGVPYRIVNDGNLSYMYITFTGQNSETLFERADVTHANSIFGGYERLLTYWENSLETANESNIDLISESVVLYTFSQLISPKNTKQHISDEIIKYIEANFNNCDLTLNSVASEFGYNAKYISRIFKENVGVSFSEYLKNVRIKHAVFLLEQNISSVKNVAFLSGYSDPLYFSNIFKKTIGISPSKFYKSSK